MKVFLDIIRFLFHTSIRDETRNRGEELLLRVYFIFYSASGSKNGKLAGLCVFRRIVKERYAHSPENFYKDIEQTNTAENKTGRPFGN